MENNQKGKKNIYPCTVNGKIETLREDDDSVEDVFVRVILWGGWTGCVEAWCVLSICGRDLQVLEIAGEGDDGGGSEFLGLFLKICVDSSSSGSNTDERGTKYLVHFQVGLGPYSAASERSTALVE